MIDFGALFKFLIAIDEVLEYFFITMDYYLSFYSFTSDVSTTSNSNVLVYQNMLTLRIAKVATQNVL